jgi:hypothetical protein
VMRVAVVPPSLDDRTLDQLAQELGDWPPTERLLLDARATQWASPYGLTAMLTLGQAVAEAKGPAPRLTVPDSEDVRSYWARSGFFRRGRVLRARRQDGLTPTPSDVLIHAPIRATEDVHRGRRIRSGRHILAASSISGQGRSGSPCCPGLPEHRGARGNGWLGGGAGPPLAQAAGTEWSSSR